MKRIAVLVSGGGTNLQALIDAQGAVIHSGKIALVISNVEEVACNEVYYGKYSHQTYIKDITCP